MMSLDPFVNSAEALPQELKASVMKLENTLEKIMQRAAAAK